MEGGGGRWKVGGGRWKVSFCCGGRGCRGSGHQAWNGPSAAFWCFAGLKQCVAPNGLKHVDKPPPPNETQRERERDTLTHTDTHSQTDAPLFQAQAPDFPNVSSCFCYLFSGRGPSGPGDGLAHLKSLGPRRLVSPPPWSLPGPATKHQRNKTERLKSPSVGRERLLGILQGSLFVQPRNTPRSSSESGPKGECVFQRKGESEGRCSMQPNCA